jgi:hypothetical protein
MKSKKPKLLKVWYREMPYSGYQDTDYPPETHIADMLRYDLAFINPKVPDLVAFPVFQVANGTLGGEPTVGRWSSFGYKHIGKRKNVLEAFAMLPVGLAIEESDKNDWYTYRHPKLPDGRTDYTALTRVTLLDFLNQEF